MEWIGHRHRYTWARSGALGSPGFQTVLSSRWLEVKGFRRSIERLVEGFAASPRVLGKPVHQVSAIPEMHGLTALTRFLPGGDVPDGRKGNFQADTWIVPNLWLLQASWDLGAALELLFSTSSLAPGTNQEPLGLPPKTLAPLTAGSLDRLEELVRSVPEPLFVPLVATLASGASQRTYLREAPGMDPAFLDRLVCTLPLALPPPLRATLAHGTQRPVSLRGRGNFGDEPVVAIQGVPSGTEAPPQGSRLFDLGGSHKPSITDPVETLGYARWLWQKLRSGDLESIDAHFRRTEANPRSDPLSPSPASLRRRRHSWDQQRLVEREGWKMRQELDARTQFLIETIQQKIDQLAKGKEQRIRDFGSETLSALEDEFRNTELDLARQIEAKRLAIEVYGHRASERLQEISDGIRRNLTREVNRLEEQLQQNTRRPSGFGRFLQVAVVLLLVANVLAGVFVWRLLDSQQDPASAISAGQFNDRYSENELERIRRDLDWDEVKPILESCPERAEPYFQTACQLIALKLQRRSIRLENGPRTLQAILRRHQQQIPLLQPVSTLQEEVGIDGDFGPRSRQQLLAAVDLLNRPQFRAEEIWGPLREAENPCPTESNIPSVQCIEAYLRDLTGLDFLVSGLELTPRGSMTFDLVLTGFASADSKREVENLVERGRSVLADLEPLTAIEFDDLVPRPPATEPDDTGSVPTIAAHSLILFGALELEWLQQVLQATPPPAPEPADPEEEGAEEEPAA